MKGLALWMSVAEAHQIIHVIKLSPKSGWGAIFMMQRRSSFVAAQLHLGKGKKEEIKNVMKDLCGYFF